MRRAEAYHAAASLGVPLSDKNVCLGLIAKKAMADVFRAVYLK